MVYRCITCDHYFGSQQALQQHLESSAHNFDCDKCDRNFGTQRALQQHRDSPAHKFEGLLGAKASPAYNLKTNQSPTNSQPKDMSLSQTAKDAGFKNVHGMMLSYRLKIHSSANFEEFKAIVDAFKKQDQEDWEGSQKK